MMGNNRIVRNLVLFGLLILWCFIPNLVNSVQQKTPSSPTAVKPPTAIQQIPFVIRGTVKLSQSTGAGVKDIEISLIKLVETKQGLTTEGKMVSVPVFAPVKKLTDADGRYSFVVDPKYKGNKFRVVPRYSGFPPGNYFTPPENTFILDSSVVLDFIFNSPQIKISGVSKRPLGRKIPGVEIQLYEVHGPHQFKFLGDKNTDSSGGYKFELNHYGNINKSFMVRARHPQNPIIGQGFTPAEKIFDLNGDTIVDFVYDGPLPDLVISNVRYIKDAFDPEYVIFTITNQGERGSGKCHAELGYNTYHYSTGENPYNTVTRPVPPLAPGASYEMQFWFPMYADTKNSVKQFFVDRHDEVIEKDEGNNKYPKK